MNKINTFVVIFLLAGTLCFGQNDQNSESIYRNAVHATVGHAGFMGALSLNYERKILDFREKNLKGLWAKVGFGKSGEWSIGGPYQFITLGLLTGKNKGHFEINFGGTRMVRNYGYEHGQYMNPFFQPSPTPSDRVDIGFVGSLGYRYQKPNRRFLLRYGIGYPESVYVSVGTAF